MEAAAMGAGDRDLKMMEAATMGECLKTKEVVASEGGDTLKRNEQGVSNVINLLSMMSTTEAQAVGAGKKRNEAVASEVADDRGRLKRPWEVEGGMLRLKKEADAAWDLWMLVSRPKNLPPKRKAAKAPVAGKKKMKVVKRKLPKELIEYMAKCPFRMSGSHDEEYAQHDPELRKILATAKLLEDKTREYRDALITQQKLFGYAEDEKEVTDDEEDQR